MSSSMKQLLVWYEIKLMNFQLGLLNGHNMFISYFKDSASI